MMTAKEWDMLFRESDDEEFDGLHQLMAIKFLIFMCHADFMNSARCQYLVIVEIICTVFVQ